MKDEGQLGWRFVVMGGLAEKLARKHSVRLVSRHDGVTRHLLNFRLAEPGERWRREGVDVLDVDGVAPVGFCCGKMCAGGLILDGEPHFAYEGGKRVLCLECLKVDSGFRFCVATANRAFWGTGNEGHPPVGVAAWLQKIGHVEDDLIFGRLEGAALLGWDEALVLARGLCEKGKDVVVCAALMDGGRPVAVSGVLWPETEDSTTDETD